MSYKPHHQSGRHDLEEAYIAASEAALRRLEGAGREAEGLVMGVGVGGGRLARLHERLNKQV